MRFVGMTLAGDTVTVRSTVDAAETDATIEVVNGDCGTVVVGRASRRAASD